MLSGFLEPSGGDALVEGRSVRTHMPEIYRMMGVCPQVGRREGVGVFAVLSTNPPNLLTARVEREYQ